MWPRPPMLARSSATGVPPNTHPQFLCVGDKFEKSFDSTISHGVLLHENVILGHHIYKGVWSPIDCEHGNHHDRRAVCLLKGGSVVGHAPRELAKYPVAIVQHLDLGSVY